MARRKRSKNRESKAEAPLPTIRSTPVVEVARSSLCKPDIGDIIFTEARHLLVLHNRKGFANFTDQLRVEAIMCKATGDVKYRSEIEELAITYRESIYLIPFKFAHPGPAQSLTLMCDVRGGWTSFEQWLSKPKCPPGRNSTGNKDFRFQQRWWDRTGKTFNLFGLPTELRDLVYEYAVGLEHYPSPYSYRKFYPFWAQSTSSRTTSTAGAQFGEDPRHIAMKREHSAIRPNVNLLFACKQVYADIMQHIPSVANKIFEEDYALTHYVVDSTRPVRGLGCVDNLRHLTLDFRHTELDRFFGVGRYFHNRSADHASFFRSHPLDATLLKKITHLRSIHIYFHGSVYPDSDSRDPWAPREPLEGVPHVHDTEYGRRILNFHTPCLNARQDLVLNFAKQHIEHISKISLLGAIKPSIKKKWDAIFCDKTRSEPHDMNSDLEVLSRDYDYFPGGNGIAYQRHSSLPYFKCSCTLPCAFEPFYRIVRRRENLEDVLGGTEEEESCADQYEFVNDY